MPSLHPEPSSEVYLTNGIKLICADPAWVIADYMDAYRAIDPDFDRAPPEKTAGPPLSLIQGGKCDSSEASTPD